MTANDHQLARLLDDAEDALRSLRRDAAGILKRAAIPSGRDGYPSRASGSQAVSVHPQIRHEFQVAFDGLYRAKCTGCDWESPRWPDPRAARESGRQHEDANGQAIDYSDPTGEAATSGPERDPVRQLGRDLMRDLTKAVRLLQAKANACAQEAGKGANLDDPTDWCSHHVRFGYHEPRRVVHDKTTGRDRPAGDLCKWCLDFQTSKKVLPPKELIDMRARGRSIREADVERALRRAG